MEEDEAKEETVKESQGSTPRLDWAAIEAAVDAWEQAAREARRGVSAN